MVERNEDSPLNEKNRQEVIRQLTVFHRYFSKNYTKQIISLLEEPRQISMPEKEKVEEALGKKSGILFVTEKQLLHIVAAEVNENLRSPEYGKFGGESHNYFGSSMFHFRENTGLPDNMVSAEQYIATLLANEFTMAKVPSLKGAIFNINERFGDMPKTLFIWEDAVKEELPEGQTFAQEQRKVTHQVFREVILGIKGVHVIVSDTLGPADFAQPKQNKVVAALQKVIGRSSQAPLVVDIRK